MTGGVTGRLAALGLALPPVPKPVAAYVPATRAGRLVWTSGQLPTAGGELVARGVVGHGPGSVSPERAKAAARVAVLNAVAAVASVADLDAVGRVVKVVVAVACEPGFAGQPGVADGASELLAEVWGAAGAHARAAIGVLALPLGAPVEIELIVELAERGPAAGA
jgi:enamine deaminase RidA (YjgF/YER057c/UK114 family)